MSWRKEGGGFSLRTASLRISLHRHRDHPPDVWFVSCYGDLQVERHELSARDEDEAKVEAIVHLRALVARLAAEISA